MSLKHLGECPFCKQSVRAQVVEKNILRRDKCACPSCGGTLYVCRAPACDNYAKGGDIYDDEFCPGCTSGTGTLVTGVAATVAAVLIASAAEAFFGKKAKRSR
jgi:MinD superfamily P-loop ATPase